MDPREFQESLKPMMRKQELERRANRNQIIQNNIDLLNDMTPGEKANFRKALVPPDPRGYWKRLWDAVCNRRPFG